jgi:hypothetical protein
MIEQNNRHGNGHYNAVYQQTGNQSASRKYLHPEVHLSDKKFVVLDYLCQVLQITEQIISNVSAQEINHKRDCLVI